MRIPPEFRQRAVELARLGEQPVRQVPADLGFSESCLRPWMAIVDVDDGQRPSLTSDEKAELVALHRRTRVLELENEIRERAAPYFVKENVLPKGERLHR